MSAFTITEVHGHEDWGDDGQYGPKTTFKLSLEGPGGRTEDGQVAELAQKRESPAPVVGQTLNGELVFEKGRWKFKKDKPAFNGASGGKSFGKSPKESAEIKRMHSQHMALLLLDIELRRGTLTDQEEKSTKLLQDRAEWFDKDATKAGENV